MRKTIHITGMMCPHCEATVKKALEAVPGVSVEKVSHEEGVAVVMCADAVDPTALQKAVEDKDYTVTGME